MKQPLEKIKTLIVDDEPLARRGIRQLLETETDFEIVGEARNGREAVFSIQTLAPDLIFLDVQMPVLDGFGTIEIIGAENLPPAVVFVTAFDEHAIRAFEINALDYLLKPIDPPRFKRTLERARRQIKNRRTDERDDKLFALLRDVQLPKDEKPAHLERIAIKENGRIFFLDAGEIDWIKAQGNYIEIYARNKKYLLRETMDKIETKLEPGEFVRIRRSAIVRVRQIKELRPLFNGEYEIFLKTGATVPSSRRYRKNLDALLKS